jgi:hypothetical protein
MVEGNLMAERVKNAEVDYTLEACRQQGDIWMFICVCVCVCVCV